MPNYNYRPNDYMRRSQCYKQVTSAPARVECQNIVYDDNSENNCCRNDILSDLPLAMAYVPWQEWQNLYSAETALCKGTIFKDLDKPFLRIGGCMK